MLAYNEHQAAYIFFKNKKWWEEVHAKNGNLLIKIELFDIFSLQHMTAQKAAQYLFFQIRNMAIYLHADKNYVFVKCKFFILCNENYKFLPVYKSKWCNRVRNKKLQQAEII